MSIPVQCASCGQKLAAPINLAGRQVACPKCKAQVKVPSLPVGAMPMAEIAPESARPQWPPPPRHEPGFLPPGANPLPPTGPMAPGTRPAPSPFAVSPLQATGAGFPPDLSIGQETAPLPQPPALAPQKAVGFQDPVRPHKATDPVMIVAAVLIVALLGGGVFAALRLFGRAAATSDLRYVPDDSDMVITVDVKALWNSGVGQKLRSAAGDKLEQALNQMQSQAGMRPEDIGRMTMGAKIGSQKAAAVIHFNKTRTEADFPHNGPITRKDVGQYKLTIIGGTAYCLIDSTTALVGEEAEVTAILNRDGSAKLLPDVDAAMKEIDFSRPVAFAVSTANLKSAPGAGMALSRMPGGADGVRGGAFQADVGDDIRAKAVAFCKDDQLAQQFKEMLAGGLAMVRMQGASLPGNMSKIIDSVTITNSGSTLTVTVSIDKDTVAQSIDALPLGKMGGAPPSPTKPGPGAAPQDNPPGAGPTSPTRTTAPNPLAEKLGDSARRMRVKKDLSEIGLALLSYENKEEHLPPPAIYGRDGKPLLSWRVAILPYLNDPVAAGLYKQIHLDEPWNSAHNKRLVALIPSIYRSTPDKVGRGKTCYLAITGEGAAFNGQQGTKITDFQQGTSKCVLVVEAAPRRAVEWTKPDDLPIGEANVAGGLFGQHDAGALVLFGDTHVGLIRPDTPGNIIRAACSVAPQEELPANFGSE